jgi:serine/threonine protein kinase
MASLIGQTLGQYQIVAQLGHGGMATVYKAYHPRLDRYVAVKVVHQMFIQDESFLARFEREAQIVASLDHPHIVPVYDFNEFHGQPYLVMKFIEGATLKSVLANKTLSLDEILKLMPPIAEALDYAHRRGVLHRDIKPSNIMIDGAGVPYLTDFGLARMVKSGESSLSHDLLLGTPNYISPEQAQGKADITARTDQYSLGVVLYELVTGQVPFNADTPFAVVHSHIYVPPPAPSTINPAIPPAVDAVLMRALAKDPDARFESAAEMVSAFTAAVRDADMNTINAARDQMRAAMPIPAGEDSPTIQTPPPSIESPVHDETPGGTPRRVVEASFDFGNVGASIRKMSDNIRVSIERDNAPPDTRKAKPGQPNASISMEGSLREVGESIRDAVEDVFNGGDLDIAAEDDESAARKRIERQLKKRNEFNGHAIAYVFINAFLWIIYLGMSGGSFLDADMPPEATAFPWPLVISMGWGAGFVAHAIETHFETGKRAARRLRIIRDSYRREFGANWARVASRNDLKRIRRRAEAPIKKRIEFFEHLGVYTMINLMLWMIYIFAMPKIVDVLDLDDVPMIGSDAPFPWPLVVMFFWGIGLVANAVEALGASRTERAVERELERERAFLNSEKPKRALAADQDDFPASIRLTQDGELTDSMIADLDDDARRARR